MSLWDLDKNRWFFGVIPFHSLSNEINFQKDITSRKTYLGYEDNDHRYFKAKELTLDIVFFWKNGKIENGSIRKILERR